MSYTLAFAGRFTVHCVKVDVVQESKRTINYVRKVEINSVLPIECISISGECYVILG